jgi:putative redox protein
MSTKVNVTWKDQMTFNANVNGFDIIIDADEKVGGRDLGPRPKPLSLASLGGCTGMDVISILGKMRVKPDFFDIEVEAEMSDEHPKYYKAIHIKYIFKGDNLPMDKIEKAVNLSQDRYCGVSYMLKQSSELTYEIVVLD